MKKAAIQILLAVFGLKVYSQKNINLIVLASGGEKFYLVLNGVKYNTSAEASVKATGINSGTYEANIVFDGELPEIKDKIYTIWEGKPTDNMEFTYVVEKKGNAYRVRFLNAEALAPKNPTDSIKKDTVKIAKRECKGAMKENDFIVASQSIGSRNSEDSRISMADILMSKNCFNCKQIKDMCDMFEYDKSRIDFLKKAYEVCVDKENYRDLIQALDYKASKKEFEAWMADKP